MKNQHTPSLPWEVLTEAETGDRVIVDADGIVICRRPSPEDAKLIVSAINSHHRLLTYARAYEDYCKKVGGDWNGVHENIAKAGG
jgi:hypothetical protein